ncbi:hypothetical protein LXL04_020003 [Taraxacum kok-saghyz]
MKFTLVCNKLRVFKLDAEKAEEQSPVVAMVDTGSPSHSQPQQHNDDDDVQNQDPNPIQSQEANQSPPRQPPNPETLDLPNPQQSPLHDEGVHNSPKPDKDEDAHDGDDQQSQQKEDHQPGTTHTTIPEPIILPEETKNPSPSPAPPLASPINPQRRITKRKKAASRNPHKRKKVQNLTDILKPIPFIPTKTLDFVKHQEVLKRLGLYDFSKIEFDRSIRTDLVVQLIANYDQKKRSSYVNDVRINVNRTDLARALKLPAPKPERVSSSTVEEVDLDSEVFSDEAIEFIDDFVSNWILLHEDPWVMPPDLVKMTRCIKDGHPEKMDPARLIWHMVEKELTQGVKLTDCYYASHLQYLIRSQREEFFMEEDEVPANSIPDDIEEKEEEEEIERKEEEKEDKLETDEKDLIAEEPIIALNLESDVQEIVQEDVKKDVQEIIQEEEKKDDEVMVDAVECKEEVEEEEQVVVEEQGNWLLDGKNELGNHFLQGCHSDLNDYSEQKVQELEDEDEDEHEQIQQVEDEEEEEEEQEEEEEEEERADEGFDMEANDDSLDRDGLTDNFLQGVETSHNPYAPMDLFGSRDGSFMSHGGPSFFNSGKRVMETEEHDDPNPKRSKSNEIWDQKPTDFTTCMDQMQQWMEKAKMIHESKEQDFQNSQYNHEVAINQLQQRQNYMEMLIKSKDEELTKRHTEVFRLERELYLMADLVTGYRKALNDTRFKFQEYRKRYALHEDPLYKDAGPGGLVLSAREVEKQREEDRVKIVKMLKDYEEECVCKLEMYQDKVLVMCEKLVGVENEVKDVKGKFMERKVSGELLAVARVHQESVEKQEVAMDRKLPDEVVGNEESGALDADESKEQGGGEEE